MRIRDWSSDVCSSDLHPGLDFASEPKRLVDVAREDRGAQAIFGVVGKPEGFIEVIERIERRDRPEGFLGRYLHPGLDTGEDGRMAHMARPFAAGEYFGSLAAAIGRASCRERVGKYV